MYMLALMLFVLFYFVCFACTTAVTVNDCRLAGEPIPVGKLFVLPLLVAAGGWLLIFKAALAVAVGLPVFVAGFLTRTLAVAARVSWRAGRKAADDFLNL
jgi:hypothetical protein